MAQTSKKASHSGSQHKLTSHAHAATKAVSNTANKAAAGAQTALESTRNTTESMVKMGTDTVKELFTTGTEEAQKAHEKIFAMGRGNAENFSRAVEAMTRTLNDFVGVFRDNADASSEVNHIAADIAKSIHSELVSCANTSFSDNVELCKEAFACRDINDAMELHSKWLSTNMENFFSQSTRLTEMMFQLATEAAEPINERVAEATERFSKSLAA